MTDNPSVSDSVRAPLEPPACQLCGQPLAARRRDARFCSHACSQRAYRLRRQPSPSPLPRRLPVHLKVYQCPACDARYLGYQRCDDCGTFCRLLGPGGECPHCDQPVTIHDLGLA
jgi:hypothetical protein